MSKPVILLGLNELNFDYIKYYISQGELPSFKKIIAENGIIETTSEDNYELLEPWIQWVTLHTGMSYEEHKVFRLGDIEGRNDLSQIFEEVEDAGKTVGAISPFNASNRLKKASFFVPDPWTKTKVTGSFLTNKLYEGIHQSVNENAKSKLSISTMMSILSAVILNVSPVRWPHYVKSFLKRKKPGYKAIILDSLLSDVFFSLWKKTKPDFANLFLNTGAHVQHHYLFNSAAYKGAQKNPEWYCAEGYDPFIEVLREYDNTLRRLMDSGATLVLATGLHQNPHEHVTYYWRLNEHKDFLKKIGINNFTNVLPRMSRDFLAEFASVEDALVADKLLSSYKSTEGSKQIFQVDNRGKSLFVELIYDKEIKDSTSITSEINNIEVSNFKKYVAFVAIKNGEHNGIGYLISTGTKIDAKVIPLKTAKDIIKKEIFK